MECLEKPVEKHPPVISTSTITERTTRNDIGAALARCPKKSANLGLPSTTTRTEGEVRTYVNCRTSIGGRASHLEKSEREHKARVGSRAHPLDKSANQGPQPTSVGRELENRVHAQVSRLKTTALHGQSVRPLQSIILHRNGIRRERPHK